MARIAVVENSSNVVIAICIADVNDPPYAGAFFVDVDNTPCDIGWIYDPVVNDFVNPNPPPDEPVTEIV
jgi:hypothetical protein